MKKKINIRSYVLFLLPAFGFISLFSQEADLKIKEKVKVINVEVPVRVFYKGQTVENLTKKDFKLYEGNRLQAINGFYSKKKCIQVQNVNLKPDGQAGERKIRYIVLIFRISDFNVQLQEGVRYLFKNIIFPEDQLLVFVNEKTLPLTRPQWKIKREDIILDVLREESLTAHQRLISYFLGIMKDLERTQRQLIEDERVGQNPYTIIDFLRRYLMTWQEYKKKYLIPDLDKYYNFAKHLEKIDGEKWIINFYQIEMFPKIQITGRLRQKIETLVSELMVARPEDSVHSQIITKYMENIDKELNVSNDFPVEEISKLMYKVDTTFHSVFMGVKKETLEEDFQFQRISSDIENCLRELTKKTGGSLLSTGDLGQALHAIESKQDLYYVLTYSPENPEKIEKITIKLNNKNYEAVYDDNFRADYISNYLKRKKSENPNVVLKDLIFQDGKVHMNISDFKIAENPPNEKTGKLNIQVQVKNLEGDIVFDQTRVIVAKKETINLSIGFEWMEKGIYHVIVDVTDMFTGYTTMDFLDSIQMD